MDWKNKPNQIFNKVKNQMFAKGIESFRFVDLFTHDFDPEATGKLTPHFFNLMTNKIGVFFTTQEIRNIKDIYSKDNGIISYYFQEPPSLILNLWKMSNIQSQKKSLHSLLKPLINLIQTMKALYPLNNL